MTKAKDNIDDGDDGVDTDGTAVKNSIDLVNGLPRLSVAITGV